MNIYQQKLINLIKQRRGQQYIIDDNGIKRVNPNYISYYALASNISKITGGNSPTPASLYNLECGIGEPSIRVLQAIMAYWNDNDMMAAVLDYVTNGKWKND